MGRRIKGGKKGFLISILLILIFIQGCDNTFLDEIKAKIAGDESSDANLSGLTLSQGILYPEFISDTTTYFVLQYSTVSSLTVTADTSSPYASLSVNGSETASGAPSGSIVLSTGHNSIQVNVTAGNGTATKTYTISVCRAAVDLPRTGQTAFYATGDDGDLEEGVPRPSPRFYDHGNTITDNLTGLMWVKAPDGITRDWEGALSHVNGLSGVSVDYHNDWRLPNRAELRSLFNYQNLNTATWLNGQGFTGVQSGSYWMSTTCQPDTTLAWAVNMWYGYFDFFPKTVNISYVFPVRTGETVGTISLAKTGQTESYSTTDGEDGDLEIGVPWPDPRFTNNDNGTITDNLTGLMWEKSPSDTVRNWAGYLTYANNLTLAGFDDWHLPNINELESLFNAGVDDLSTWLEGQGFENVPSDVFWSSTTYAPSTANAWFIQTSSTWQGGYLFHQNKTTMPFGPSYALAVRSGR